MLKASALHQKYLAEKIKKLSTLASAIRNSIKHSKLFGEAKCRPKTENSTRWFSLEVPMTIDKIEMYSLQKLLKQPLVRLKMCISCLLRLNHHYNHYCL